MFGAAAITIHSINGYRRRQPVWKKRLSRTRASEDRESRRLRSDFAAKTSVILSDMNRFCAAQSRAKSTVKKLPGGVDFPKNRWIRHFLKELPMGYGAAGMKRPHTDFNFKAFASPQDRLAVQPDPTELCLGSFWFKSCSPILQFSG